MTLADDSISKKEARVNKYVLLQKIRPELHLPDWNDLYGWVQTAVLNGEMDVAAERTAYILAGGITHWSRDEWVLDVPF